MNKKLPDSILIPLRNDLNFKVNTNRDITKNNCYNTGSTKTSKKAKVNFSNQEIGEIRLLFFKTIVSLFQGYQKSLDQDEDGDTIFMIQEYVGLRPRDYQDFYRSFFQNNYTQLEHFGYMEFLNLAHSKFIDSEQA